MKPRDRTHRVVPPPPSRCRDEPPPTPDDRIEALAARYAALMGPHGGKVAAGRGRALTDGQRAELRRLRSEGLSASEAGRRVGVSGAAARKACRGMFGRGGARPRKARVA